MTTPDPIDAAIAEGIDAYVQAAVDLLNVPTIATEMSPGMGKLIAAAIRAAAPILIAAGEAAGREAAAKQIATWSAVICADPTGHHLLRCAELLARGGTP